MERVFLSIIEWFIIPIHPSSITSKVESTLYNTTWYSGGGYQSVLTTSDNGTFNTTIIYRCIASNDSVSAYSNTTVTIEGMCVAEMMKFVQFHYSLQK